MIHLFVRNELCISQLKSPLCVDFPRGCRLSWEECVCTHAESGAALPGRVDQAEHRQGINTCWVHTHTRCINEKSRENSVKMLGQVLDSKSQHAMQLYIMVVMTQLVGELQDDECDGVDGATRR